MPQGEIVRQTAGTIILPFEWAVKPYLFPHKGAVVFTAIVRPTLYSTFTVDSLCNAAHSACTQRIGSVPEDSQFR